MHPSTTKKEIQSLTGWLVALNRFISRYSNHLPPFFKALKGADTKGWVPKCDDAFRAIKEYITSPLSLSQSVEEKELYPHLAALATDINATLVRLDPDCKKMPVYFISKALSEVETRYTNFERVALALKMETKKL